MAAELKAKVSLDTTAFTRGLNTVSKQLASVGASIGKIGAIAGAAAAGIGAIGAVSLARGVKEAIDFGGALGDLSVRTGAPIKDVMILQQAFKDAGISSAAVGSSLNKMQQALAGVNEDGEPTNKTFEKLGLSTQELLKQNPGQQFAAISKAISSLANPAERTAAAMGVFGKSGGELITLFKDPAALGNAAKIIGSQAEIFARNAEALDKVSDTFNSIGVKFRGFFAGVAESLLPALQKAGDFLASVDLAPMGKKLGDAISSALNVLTNGFKEGKLGELFGLSLKLGFMKSFDFIISSMAGLSAVVQEAFGQGMAVMANPAFWQFMQEGLIGVFSAASAGFLKSFSGPLKAIQDLITFMLAKVDLWLDKAVVKFLELTSKIIPGLKDNLERARTTANRTAPTLDEVAKASEQGGGFSLGGLKANDFEGSAGVAFQNATEKLKEALSSGALSSEAIKKAFTEASAGAGMFEEGIEKTQTELMALFNSLNKPLTDLKNGVSGGVGQGGGQNLIDATQKAATVDSDRLARIGGFVGGGASSAINFARLTANNTTQMVKGIQKLIEVYKPSESQMGAAWGI